jgi:hypothetical protein
MVRTRSRPQLPKSRTLQTPPPKKESGLLRRRRSASSAHTHDGRQFLLIRWSIVGDEGLVVESAVRMTRRRQQSLLPMEYPMVLDAKQRDVQRSYGYRMTPEVQVSPYIGTVMRDVEPNPAGIRVLWVRVPRSLLV